MSFCCSSGSWEKNKRYAEQAAAMVAIACLGVDDSGANTETVAKNGIIENSNSSSSATGGNAVKNGISKTDAFIGKCELVLSNGHAGLQQMNNNSSSTSDDSCSQLLLTSSAMDSSSTAGSDSNNMIVIENTAETTSDMLTIQS